MKSIWTMGELLVEIMRPNKNMYHHIVGEYLGPYPSGAPAIFIDSAARLGVKAGIIGGIGKDGFGKNLKDRLSTDGVNLEFVTENANHSTAVAFVMYKENGDREYIFHIAKTAATEIELPDETIDDVGYFHVVGCSITSDPDFAKKIIEIMIRMKDNGATISFDPNIRPELLYGDMKETIQPVMDNCSILFPGAEELKIIAGCNTVEASAEKLFENEKLEIIVLKQGSRGCRLITRKFDEFVPAYKIKQVDPTGAGDCFDAAFLYGLMQGMDYVQSAKIASAAGALNAMAFGPMEGKITKEAIVKIMEEGNI